MVICVMVDVVCCLEVVGVIVIVICINIMYFMVDVV